MWYSSFRYQRSPKAELLTVHFCSEKSSENDEGNGAAEFVFLELLLLIRLLLVFRLAVFVLTTRLLFDCEFMLAMASSITKTPIPSTTTTASPPNTHHTALDFRG